MRPKDTFKLKRLRDGNVADYDATHALNLLRLNAGFAKSEFELAEKNYTFKNNEIYRNPKATDNKGAKVQGQDTEK